MKVNWSSPSNIALVKYWGKYGDQLPSNPSISFTLQNAYTSMSVEIQPKSNPVHSVEFFFEGLASAKFAQKIISYLNKISGDMYWVNEYDFYIHSSNTFPHSSGIASSASSMSALALCLVSLDCHIKNKKMRQKDFFKLASSYARRASGSASRSVYPLISIWGHLDWLNNTSDEWAIPFDLESSLFQNYHDAIIIVDASEKSVSSRAGHELMNHHPFKDMRFEQARQNMKKLVEALKKDDLNLFIEVVEEEALTLHAMMMTSNPSYILLRPSSLLIIEKVREFRRVTNLPICFTIDAGPNIHLLYPDSIRNEVENWITNDLMNLVKGSKVLFDKVGSGPVLLSGEKPFE